MVRISLKDDQKPPTPPPAIPCKLGFHNLPADTTLVVFQPAPAGWPPKLNHLETQRQNQTRLRVEIADYRYAKPQMVKFGRQHGPYPPPTLNPHSHRRPGKRCSSSQGPDELRGCWGFAAACKRAAGQLAAVGMPLQRSCNPIDCSSGCARRRPASSIENSRESTDRTTGRTRLKYRNVTAERGATTSDFACLRACVRTHAVQACGPSMRACVEKGVPIEQESTSVKPPRNRPTTRKTAVMTAAQMPAKSPTGPSRTTARFSCWAMSGNAAYVVEPPKAASFASAEQTIYSSSSTWEIHMHRTEEL